VATNILWVFPVAFLFFRVLDLVWGNRVTAKGEILGLDITEMGVPGYVSEDPIEVKMAGQDHLTTQGPGVPRKRGPGTPAPTSEKGVPVHYSS
jgi:hypothetical protein